MRSFIEYINENLENLGGANPYKNKEPFYLNFYLRYNIDFVLKQFALKINNIRIDGEKIVVNGIKRSGIERSGEPINKSFHIKDVLSKLYSTYYPQFDELGRKYENVDYILTKKTPQGLLRNIDIAGLLNEEDNRTLREILTSIDPTFNIWRTIKDEKSGRTNDAELRLKDLLTKNSGIRNIEFKTYFKCRYKLLVRPIYFKNKNKIARFDVSVIEKRITMPTDKNDIYFEIYDSNEISKENESLCPIARFNGTISFENRNFMSFLNKFIINRFEPNKQFFLKFFK